MPSATEKPRVLHLCAPVTDWNAIEASDANAAGDRPSLRRFSMTAYTGGAMTLAGWPHPVVVDLAGMRVAAKSRPILKDHNRSLIVGHTDSIGVQNSQLQVTGVVSGAGPVAREIVESSLNGFPWQASLGAVAQRVEFVAKGRTARVNGREFAGPLHIARESVLGEVSFVALGADDDTTAQIAAKRSPGRAAAQETNTMTFEQWLEAKGFADADLNDAQRASLEALFASEPDASTATATATDDAPTETDSPSVTAQMRAEAAAESSRIAAIRRLCSPLNGRHADLEAKAIADGWDVTRTELELLRAERPALAAGGVRRDGDAGVAARTVEAALCLSAGIPEAEVGKWYDQRTMNAAVAGRLRGAGVHAALGYAIEAVGGSSRGTHVDNDFILTAFEADRQLRAQERAERTIRASGGGFSTISLSGILSNVANKAMLAAYQAVDSVVAMFCADADVADFKEVTRYRLTGNGVFEKVGPDGELKHATLSEESYTNRVETFGRIFALTRQMIINDDLGAFLQIPRIIGRMSALKREEAVFELLLANPGTFFSVGNKNFLSGVDTALSIDSLTKAEQTFMDQTDSDGKPILISPSVLLVPTALKVTAQQLMTETRVNETTTTDKPKPANNPHAGKWRPVASPYLNAQGIAGGSAKAWYLFANPADVAAIEIAYLRGRRVPTIESGETNFNTLGMQWRGYFDFGVAMQDRRAAVKVKGEA
ncbi:MAG: Mu-like prophage major head subunit gpT family protein [Phycisphaeraceae bacterium]|nr:Mu-like prophage major head subunit gpT family protein [Phycisphaeraceae bacterium]